jgi:sugar phosphate isomerase/epimerase
MMACYVDHIRALVDMGYSGFELHTVRSPEIDAAFGSYSEEIEAYGRFRRTLDEAGLTGVALATNTGATPSLDPSSDDPTVRDTARAFLASRVDVAAALRAEILMGPVVVPYGAFVHSAPNGDPVWSDALQDELGRRYRNAAPILDEIGRYAATRGVKIAIEPITHWETPGPNTLAQLLDFLELVPSTQVGAVIDSAHETLDGAGPEVFARQVESLAAAGRLHYAQASPPDRGDLASSWLPWEPLFGPVLAHYAGPVAIEIFNAVPDFASGLRLSRRKYWVPGVDAPSDRPSAYDVASTSLATLRDRFRDLDDQGSPPVAATGSGAGPAEKGRS